MSSLIAQYAEPVKDTGLGIELSDSDLDAALARALSLRQDYETDADLAALESLSYQLNLATEACGNMNTIQLAVKYAAESGNSLSPSALKMLRIATESEMSRVSVVSQDFLPAAEHFVERSTRLNATTLAAESIAESLKGMLDKLVKAITAIWAHIKAFLKKIFSRREEVTKKMHQLEDQAKDLPEDATSAKYMDEVTPAAESADQHINRRFHFGIKDKCNGDTTRIIVKNHMDLITANREIILNIVDCLGHVADIGEKEKLLDWEIEHLVNNIKDKFDRFTLTQKKLIDNKTIYSYGYFYNDQVCLLREQLGRGTDDEHTKLFNLEIHIGKLPGQDYRPEVLQRKDMIELASKSVELMDKAAGLEKVIPIVEKVLHATTDKLNGKFNVSDDKNERETVISAIHVIRDLFKYVTNTLPKLVSDATIASDNLSGYIRLSISMHHA